MNTWQADDPWQAEPDVLLAERRKLARSAPFMTGTHLWLDEDRRIAVRVVDESAGGIGVLVPDTAFELGPRVCVDVEGRRRAANVAYLARQPDGMYRLGLEWAE